jgi:uncharacterized membrane protein YcaP (DUF421 family)
MSVITLKNETIRGLVAGKPRIIIRNGEIDQHEMKNLRYTIDDLLEAMRDNGVFCIDDVQYAVAETTGKINFLSKTPDNPTDPPVAIIKNSAINQDGLRELNITSDDVTRILFGSKVTLRNVFLLTADKAGRFTLIKRQR